MYNYDDDLSICVHDTNLERVYKFKYRLGVQLNWNGGLSVSKVDCNRSEKMFNRVLENLWDRETARRLGAKVQGSTGKAVSGDDLS